MILSTILKSVVKFVGDDLGLNGVLIEFTDKNTVTLVATEGYMLIVVDVENDHGQEVGSSVLVSPVDIKNVADSMTHFNLSIFDEIVYFMGNVVVMAKPLKHEFPDYKNAIKEEDCTDAVLTLDVGKLQLMTEVLLEFRPFIYNCVKLTKLKPYLMTARPSEKTGILSVTVGLMPMITKQ